MASFMGNQVAAVAANAVNQAATGPARQWTTEPCECSSDKIPGKDIALAIFFWPCVFAYAKGEVMKSNPLFDFFCITPCHARNEIRSRYNIAMPDTPCTDVLYGSFGGICGARQAKTEVDLVGAVQGSFGQLDGKWSSNLFSCECSECAMATFCPCIVTHKIRSLMLPTSAAAPWFNYLCVFPFSQYGAVRHEAGLGSEWPHPVCEDCLVGSLLYPCALMRAQREAVAFQARKTTANAVGAAKGAIGKIVSGFGMK